jgi:basic membrane protein A
VEVLGWDPAAQTGLFTGNFESTDDGRTMGLSLMDEGADIIMPVAGPVGLGTAAAAQERGNVYIVGVDNDWFFSASDYADIILTSVLKNMDVLTYGAIESVLDGSFEGGVTVGTLENGGVGLAPFHDMESMVPSDLVAELDEIKAGIIAGDLSALPGEAPPEPEETEAPMISGEGYKACQVTDTGGIDDRSFNATAWKGVQDAMDELGVEGKYLESQQQTDYEKNINAFIEDGCDLIVTVGFLLGDATGASAEANPEQKFSIVDFAYDPAFDNVLGQVFNTQEAAFLAGYAAAAVSQTGKVGTFGGIQIPPVTVFMDGFALGVAHYNEKMGTNVEVLGWDPAAQTGLFTGNFESTDDGRTMGLSLMDEGADIIMPVAGPVGLGTAAAAQERGNVYIVGVDNDWFFSASDYADIILTSVLKNMDVLTYDAIVSVIDGSFEGGVIVGTLENGGVGLAPFHDMESMVPSDLVAELDQIKAGIIAGDISASP